MRRYEKDDQCENANRGLNHPKYEYMVLKDM